MKSPIEHDRIHDPAPTPPTLHSKRPVALLVSGDPELADRYGARLRSDGYAVVPASGLERGLELAAGVQPDLLFVCMGAWAVPALVLLVLRCDRATAELPTILVSE